MLAELTLPPPTAALGEGGGKGGRERFVLSVAYR